MICAGVRIFERFIATQHAAKLSSVSGLHCAAVMRRRSTASASVITTTAAIDAVESRKNVLNIELLILFITLPLVNTNYENKLMIYLKMLGVNLRNISSTSQECPIPS
ncbi:hypothetical protein AB395_00002048 [Sinorhizobium fredii CCBAU 45436]|nr:hypothetical protein SF83666_c20330 [Sinorhizobium fredii CCBAU 83666]AWI57701.1 hypothetical protein AB395_00002048 [Sinorhizobium fredii CCBAU 45436]